jgi:CBS domain containing-hemolysin-like protein
MKFVFILIELAFIKCILLYRVYHDLPILELKRRAQTKEHRAAALYKVAAYRDTLDVTVWLVGFISAVVVLVWAARTTWWAVLVIVLAADILMRRPGLFTADNWAGGFAAFFAPYHARVLSFLQPAIGQLARLIPARPAHSGIFTREDLLEQLKKQIEQSDNRINQSDLKIASGALSFGDKLVRDVMTPRRQIKFVSANESIGPLLMDELHKSGHSRFPVTKDSTKAASPDVIGTLYLKDIVSYEGGGKVKDLSRKDVHYINEDSDLRQALSAFLKTHHHLLIVVNSFEEIAGMLSIDDVMEQIIGQPITDGSDDHRDLRAVAKEEAQKDKENHNEDPVASKAE